MSRICVRAPRRVRRSRDTVVSIGTATYIGAALRAAKRNAASEELERHLQSLRSLEENDFSIILVMQWLEEQLRSSSSQRRVKQSEHRTRAKTVIDAGHKEGEA